MVDVDTSRAEAEVKSEEQLVQERQKREELEKKLAEYEQKEQERAQKQKEEEEKSYFQSELDKQREAFEKQLEEVKSMRMSDPEGGGDEGTMTQQELEEKFNSDPEFRAQATKEALKLTGNPKYS